MAPGLVLDQGMALEDWQAMVARVRDGERIDAAAWQTSLDALNSAYAGLIGLTPPTHHA